VLGPIVRTSLHNRFAVVGVALAMVVAGLVALLRLEVDVLPDINRPALTVMTEAGGLGPEEVDTLVTRPLERALVGLPSMLRMRSSSALGLSVVTLELDWGSDVTSIRQQAAERLAAMQRELPNGVTPHIQPVSSIMGEIMLVAVTATDKSHDGLALRALAEWSIRPRLQAIAGVSQVTVIGGALAELRVEPDLKMMAGLEISLADLERALARFGIPAGGGFATPPGGGERTIRALGGAITPEALGSLVVATRGGVGVRLDQIASVALAPRPERGSAGVNGAEAVILSVQKQPGADTRALTPLVTSQLAELQKTMPAGVKADHVLFRQADFIQRSLGNVSRVLIEASVVVAIVLFVFLGSARTTVISLIAIPVSLLAAVIVFLLTGISINTMTLGGLAIAIGELVDDAVVDVENVHRRLKERGRAGDTEGALGIIAAASTEVRSGIVLASAIIALVVTPLFLIGGVEGQMLRPLAAAYVVGIGASLLTAITLTPALCAILLRPGSLAPAEPRATALAKRLLERALPWAMARERTVLACALAAVVIAGAIAVTLPRALMPPFNEGTLTITLAGIPGLSLEESSRLGRAAETLIKAVPEVNSVGRRTGRAELDEHSQGVETSEIDVALRNDGRSRPEVLHDIRQRLAQLPGAFNIGQPISHRIDHLTAGVRAGLVIKLFGTDIDTLDTHARALVSTLRGTPGLVDLQIEQQARVPTIEVRPDAQRAALLGIPGQAGPHAVLAFAGGRVVSHIWDGDRRIEVVIRLAEHDRTAEGLAAALIDTPEGRAPLAQIADVTEVGGRNRIERENGQQRLAVLANLEGSEAGRAVEAARGAVAALKLPPGYSATIEGTYLAQAAATQTVLATTGIVLLLILAMLAVRYRSPILALIVMASVPLALVGGVIGLMLAGLPVSLASVVGFITLAGIAVRNSILKISHFLYLAASEGMAVGEALLVRGSLERLPPVLMTACAAAGGLLPLIVGSEPAGKEILYPVAVVVFGGLISATVLDAIVTPLLVRRFGARALEQAKAGWRGGY
jgi:HME family heavy-metal exporter